ncbi:MAG: tRNA modification GTPase [Candidatus Marinamargulisbacteria bacterium]|jgi:tRNA modification GTPase
MSSLTKELIPNFQTDTIAAIATPLGVAGIGIVRVSGPSAKLVAAKVFPGHKNLRPRYVYYGDVVSAVTPGKVLDDGCVVLFEGPKSFTGEDVVEIQTHSSHFILKQVLNSVLACGCRLAGPGEFTKRAFINGKIDLTKSESIIDLIHATSEKSHAVALSHLKGRLFSHISELRQSLVGSLEQIEASIDFPDEVEGVERPSLIDRIEAHIDDLDQILSIQDYGEVVHSGVTCLIVGKPNVGKSSLLNAFLGKDRAIVTDVPGTTRDFLEGVIDLNGLHFRLIDTAGMRKSDNPIEKMGIKKAEDLLEGAHVIFFMLDGSRDVSVEDRDIMARIGDRESVYILINKTDCDQNLALAELPINPSWPVFSISAKTQAGMEKVRLQLIKDFVEKIEGIDLDLLCNVRQIYCLEKVKLSLVGVLEGLSGGFEDDVLSIDLKEAILVLGEITGDSFTEEMLDGIFSRFCIGK